MTGYEQTSSPEPTRRRVVLAYLLVSAIGIAGLVALGEALRHDGQPAGPPAPELAQQDDPLRQDIECPVPPAREGATRPPSVMGPEPPVAVTSTELLDCPGWWDGRAVRYVGEVVGTILDRGDHAWVQLNDDVYADIAGPLPTHRDYRGHNAGVGARLSVEHVEAIGVVGGPHRQGDLVEVEATFHRVEPGSGEVAVLRVRTLTVLRDGDQIEVPSVPARRAVALLAGAIALAVVALERRRRRSS